MIELKARGMEKNEKQQRTNMDDLMMWYRLGHFLRWVGAALLILGAGIFLMALAVHAGQLPAYTKTLLILITVFGLAGIFGGNFTIASVYKDPDWTGENENKRRHGK